MGLGPGALVGGYAGATDDPNKYVGTNSNQTSSGTQTSTQTHDFGPLSDQERQLQQSSLQNYLQQQALGSQYEQGISSSQDYQNAARNNALSILNGGAFQVTPQEQAMIEQQRQATVNQGTSDVNKFLDQRLQGLASDAGQRGVRGQAYSQLQGDQLRSASDELGRITNQASSQAAQQTMNAPYQRIQAQSPYTQGGLSFADNMRLQAMQNRSTAQNPYLLQLMQNERLAGGTTTSSGTSTNNESGNGMNTQYGEPGSFRRALVGGYAGMGSDAQMFANVGKGVAAMGAAGG